ncbi:MAG: anthranilate phosphoribosyltransferase [Bauldia sp.]
MASIKPLLGKVASGASLTREEAREAFEALMSGEATPSQIGGFLMALRVRGETVDEIAGAVSVMRDKMVRVEAPAHAIDVVGTGGDATGTYNISTCAAIVVAGAGVPVAKHGNRALSSKSGAADVLAALGVRLELTPAEITRCIADAGIGFMFAPGHHSAMKHVGPTRVELGTRTIFNLLGPLSNPAGVKRQLLGVYAPQWVEPLAYVLRDLGAEAAWVVHGAGGVDEISLSGPTKVAELRDGKVRTFEIEPAGFGLPVTPLEAIQGGDSAVNAVALKTVLASKPTAYRHVVLVNAAASLVIAGRAEDLREGIVLAKQSIDEGAAADRLARLVNVSNGRPADHKPEMRQHSDVPG